MPEAATNNLLIDLRSAQRLGLRFDERFGLSGGSDSLFTRQLTDRGGVIRWAEHSVVFEQEAPERITREWVLMRTFRFGNTRTRTDVARASGATGRTIVRLRATGRGLARIVGGGLRWVRGMATGSLGHRARGLRTLYRGLGMVAGAFGHVHNEYARRHAG